MSHYEWKSEAFSRAGERIPEATARRQGWIAQEEKEEEKTPGWLPIHAY